MDVVQGMKQLSKGLPQPTVLRSRCCQNLVLFQNSSKQKGYEQQISAREELLGFHWQPQLIVCKEYPLTWAVLCLPPPLTLKILVLLGTVNFQTAVKLGKMLPRKT